MGRSKKLEFIPRIVAEKLEAHAKVIHTLIVAQRRGAAEQFGYAFLAGRALLQAKNIVPNGNIRTPNAGFKHWVKANFPEITMRTAENWMVFAESILTRAQSNAATSPLLLGSIEMNGQSHESILQLVPEVMNGQGMIRFMRDCRLLREQARIVINDSSTATVKRDDLSKARRLWGRILKNLRAGEEFLERIESPDDLKSYLDAVTAAQTKIRSLIQKRSESGTR